MFSKLKKVKEGIKSASSSSDDRLMVGLDIGTEFVKALIARIDDNEKDFV